MRWLAWTMLMAAVLGAASLNDELNPVRTHPHGAADTAVERLIIKLREAAGATAVIAAAVAPEQAQIDAMTAWDTTTGSATLVIADLDTGVRYDHPDLLAASAGGRLLPGYCFISDSFVANGGTCPGADASDPGDWVTQSDITGHPTECSGGTPQNSSWHGTRTAGLLGAITNNAMGIAGVTWQTQILPVRVLGKCGGFESDIDKAMLWAAGISVANTPANTHPAKVINMSFGAASSCTQADIDTINQVAANGVLVVVSAGNEGGPVDT